MQLFEIYGLAFRTVPQFDIHQVIRGQARVPVRVCVCVSV